MTTTDRRSQDHRYRYRYRYRIRWPEHFDTDPDPDSDLAGRQRQNLFPAPNLSFRTEQSGDPESMPACAMAHESGRPLTITVPIASPDGQTDNRHIHLEKDPNASIIATAGWLD